MEKISSVVIHHSASSRNGTTLEDIRRWHTDPGRPGGPFDDIGYHFVIDGRGHICHGRKLPEKGAHATPNEGRIGVCIVGDNTKPGDEWNAEQIISTRLLLASLRMVWPDLYLFGHGDLKGHETNECPGVNVKRLFGEYYP